MVAQAFLSTDHPLLAHIIPIRRCNLACEYCNEYDDFSKPVPTETMFQRVDKLAELRTSVITISGGEPLLHPELDAIISRIRKRGMIAGLITNGYLLVPERIERLNRAGLEWLQISIDNVTPDEVSKKSLKVLDKKLELLAEYADFHVNINSVVGGGVLNPQDALMIGKRALELGFSSTIGIIHDGDGQVQPLSLQERRVYHEMKAMEKRSFIASTPFRRTLPRAEPTSGVAAPARVTYTFAKMAWCTTARSSEGIRGLRWKSTRCTTSAASTSPRKAALHTAPFPACIRSRFSIPGEPHSNPPWGPRDQANWCRSINHAYFLGCAVGGNRPFRRRYMAAAL